MHKSFYAWFVCRVLQMSRIANAVSRADLCIKVCNLVSNEFVCKVCIQALYILWAYFYENFCACMLMCINCYAWLTFTWYAFYTSVHQICIYCRRLAQYHTNLYMVRVLFYALSLLHIVVGALFMHYHCRCTFDALWELVQLEASLFFSLHIVYSCFFFIHCWS
jgi:hypothetical protein